MSMQKRFGYALPSLTVLAVLLLGTLSMNYAFAKGGGVQASSNKYKVSAKPAIAKLVAMHTVDMRHVPPKSAHAGVGTGVMPFLTGHSPAEYARIKAAAAHNTSAPHLTQAFSGIQGQNADPNTPPLVKKFQGMADSGATCPYFGTGCQPPDMAVAASTQWVLQGVNTSVAVYDTNGTLQSGWPMNAQQFFGVPNPPQNCDPAGPFLSDPRAFYDTNDGRFWVSFLQLEGALGIGPNCPFQTTYWAAVSQTSDPSGKWNVYAFDMSLGKTNVADYTQIGFDAHAFYFTANMFNAQGTAYEYAETFSVNKSTMEMGSKATAYGFSNLMVGSVAVDTVQPVEAQYPTHGGPPAGLLINSFNMYGDPNGNDCLSKPCSGLEVWGELYPGTAQVKLTGTYVATTQTYLSPPNADQPGCSQCVETIDNRITATPVLSNGLISWAIGTAVQNKTQVVPAILWGQVLPQIVNGQLKSAVLFQAGYFGFEGDQDASFGALRPDVNGDMIMVYDTMSSSLNPSFAFTGRRATYPLGSFHDAGRIVVKGTVPTTNQRWGDYEATSYDSFSSDNLWFASQYSGSTGDWATAIGVTQFRLKP